MIQIKLRIILAEPLKARKTVLEIKRAQSSRREFCDTEGQTYTLIHRGASLEEKN